MGFKLKAADGTPLEIKDGQYYFNTKARSRRMMANSLSSDARRVYACLELATMGFQQELAVVQERCDQEVVTRPLTPTDIRLQTGLPKQHVRRGLEELEEQGLAQRVSDDNGPLRNGHIQIYSWAVPREAKAKKVAARGYLPAWFPDSWEPFKPLINRYKYSLIEDEVAARDYFEEGAEVARAYQYAEEVAARFLERVRADRKKARPSLLNERTERTRERPAAAVLEEPPPPASLPPAPIESYVAEELSIDEDAAERLVAGCKEVEPSVTGPEIVELARSKLVALRGQKILNPVGLLIKHVPRTCKGGTLRAIREQIETQKKERAQRVAYAREAWGGLNEAERSEVLQKYPELAEIGAHSP